MKIRRPSARIAAAVASVGIAVVMSGCSNLNPIQTHEFYQSAEGTVANVYPAGPGEPVGLRNMLMIKTDDGAGLFTGTLSNDTAEEQTVQLTGKAGDTELFSETVTIPANGTVDLGEGEHQAIKVDQLSGIEAGDNMQVTFSAAGSEDTVTVAVLDTSLPYLKEYVEGLTTQQ
ncbi:hypothetical protein [Helcobacillus massiliensis]|uniref:DNA modification methylase n=1 Tax=Helcobacillus massiliensis TaxID=521392 RepID=A0A839QSE7_9MICO|nr:hypothetical protein [Helcobacillus massiliensis]MBB3023423.1 hypothetical protein [Helcobacillus massiliensis]